MYKIRYYYSSLAKQFFLCVVLLSVLVRFTLFFVGGFYKEAYTIATVIVYFLILAFLAFLLIAWRFFYSTFDEDTITKYNDLTKKKQEFDLAPVQRALFSRSGISLFYDVDEKPQFFIPFYRFGIVSPVGVENFMNLMKNHHVAVEQEYKSLPGYGPGARWFSRGYVILAILLCINSFQYAVLVFLILTSH